MGRKVLVVGGAGYIGSQTAKCLARAGHEVLTFDNLSTGFKSLVKYGRLIEGDILDADLLARTIKDFMPAAVFHFAAKAYVGESVQYPELYHKNNVLGSLTLLDCLHKHAPKALFVFSSTCSLYGVSDKPLRETDPLHPMNPYAETKKLIEEALQKSAVDHGLRYAALRYFNAAGCDPDGEVGELHEPEPHLIPVLLLHAGTPGGIGAKIFGNDYPTPDGTCVRDYVHVEDLARAHVLAMTHLEKGGKNLILNLGSGKGYSNLEIVRAVEKATGKKLDLPVTARRPGDPPFLVAGGDEALRTLGWKPKHDLDSIVSTAWAWTKKQRLKSGAK